MAEASFYVEFGRKLAVARQQAGLSQSEVATRVGLSRASVANVEAGKQRVFLDQAIALAQSVGKEDLTSVLPAKPPLGKSVQPSLVTTGAKRLSRDQEKLLSGIISSIGGS